MSDRTLADRRGLGGGATLASEEVRARPLWRHTAFAAVLTALSGFFILREWLTIRSGSLSPHTVATLWLTLGVLFSVLVGASVFLLFALRSSVRSLAAGMTQELRLSADWLERLFDYAPVPYLLLDASSRISRANKAALRLFGVSSAEFLVDKRLVELVAPGAVQDVEQYVAYFKNGIAVSGEELPIERNEEERWVLFSLEILGERGPRQTGIATLTDITERRALELAKTEFVSVAAHQLRAPLSTLSWQSEMLIAGDAGALTEPQRALAKKVYHGAQYLAGVVDLLLNAARLEAGTLVAFYERVDLCLLAERAVVSLERAIDSKHLVVDTSFDERLRSFSTDPRLVDSIFLNLLSNAVKYTPGDGQVVFTIQALDDGGAAIRVRDSGIGIPAEAQPNIFTKLFRAENARHVDVKGLGIGLYIVRKVVDLLGGAIFFTSEEGKGTEFVVTVPAGRRDV